MECATSREGKTRPKEITRETTGNSRYVVNS